MKRLGSLLMTFSLVAPSAFAADVAADYPAAPPPIESPVYAQTSLITADVALALGYFQGDSDGHGQAVASGRVNIPLWAGWNEEFEVAGLTLFDGDFSTVGAFSHTYYKNPGWAGGVVLGATSLDGDGVVTAGIEGVVFLPASSYLGHLSYSWGSGGTDDFVTVSGEARYYWNPNLKFAGIATYYHEPDSDWGLMLTALAEHRFEGSMFSVFGSASWFTYDSGPDNWEVMAGVRVFFDGPGRTLQQYDYDTPFAAGRAISF